MLWQEAHPALRLFFGDHQAARIKTARIIRETHLVSARKRLQQTDMRFIKNIPLIPKVQVLGRYGDEG
ncbi:hypothetical protein AE925_16645 [Xanthomonas arboricola]|uniref:hypothetical protein n=1 Tax=Xanthomonas arboricola TaxID=56448 RepID=UPI00069D2468|nr:hypothetical protein [Xanthomonas arboricola]KOB15797.1 hypothetical protein AE925_16645 [Xanthomonas arboricola]KOB42461.1 hypothetical protein AE931_16915 [Xanthomonas arboricola]